MEVLSNMQQGENFSDSADALLDDADLDSIWTWNKTVPATIAQCVHETIAETTKKQPKALAVNAHDGTLTYKQLNDLSATLAIHLVSLGVRPGELVPLCFTKSLWATVAILGVVKAGGGIVLLDPILPNQRLEAICSQIGATYVVCSIDLCERLLNVVQPIAVDAKIFAKDSPKSAVILPLIHPQSTLYVTFTSGTTGAPKGVMISHQNVASAIHHQLSHFGFNCDSQIFDFASYGFDVSISNTLATLVAGGCICVPTESDRVANLAQSIISIGANTIDLTPSVARLILPEDIPEVKTIILSGEAVTAEDVKPWLGKLKVLNVYGPSECTATSTMNCSASSSSVEEATRIGIGMGVVTWVVQSDNHNILAPLGKVGELLLEGPLVGLGYLKDVDSTNAAFIEAPKWLLNGIPGHPGRQGRLYKTGDLVKYNRDGSLTFVGRKDTQVKIRGQRVELGEVEYRVQESIPDAIRTVAAVVQFRENTSPVLAAFLLIKAGITKKSRNPNRQVSILSVTSQIRDKLAEYLPGYMIPAIFFTLESWPLTVSGKIDHNQLQTFAQDELMKLQQSLITVDGPPISDNDEPIAYAIAEWLSSRHYLHTASNKQDDGNCFDNFIRQEFQVQISLALLTTKSISIRALAEIVSVESSGNQIHGCLPVVLARVDVMDEIKRHDLEIIAAEIQNYNATTFKQPWVYSKAKSISQSRQTVFLTGATGFIGSHILHGLLQENRISCVIALVRGKTNDSARLRVIETAKRDHWWNESYQNKLLVWSGDLSLPSLGLDRNQWEKISNQIDVVIHNGALVHWGMSYADLEAVNVTSTAQLLKLTKNTDDGRFIYVTGGRPSADDDDDDESEEGIAAELSVVDAVGYDQTKFVSESLVKWAALRSTHRGGNSRITVVSPGYVIGTQSKGIANVDDYIWRLVAANIKLGIYNADTAMAWIPIADVITTAKIIIDVTLNPIKHHPPVVRTPDGTTWQSIWKIVQDMGYMLAKRNTQEWLAAMYEDISANREAHPLWLLQHQIEMLESRLILNCNEKQGMNSQCCKLTLRLESALRRNIQFLSRTGYLPQPVVT